MGSIGVNRQMATNEQQDAASNVDSETIDRLRAEISADGDSPSTAPETAQQADRFVSEVVENYLQDPEFQFEESTVKANLEEVLLTLVAHRSTETNGKRLMDDLARVFDTNLSPGTVYPQLHDFTEDGILEQHELVRTKEYHVANREEVSERLETEMRQHLALGLFYHQALEAF